MVIDLLSLRYRCWITDMVETPVSIPCITIAPFWWKVVTQLTEGEEEYQQGDVKQTKIAVGVFLSAAFYSEAKIGPFLLYIYSASVALHEQSRDRIATAFLSKEKIAM